MECANGESPATAPDRKFVQRQDNAYLMEHLMYSLTHYLAHKLVLLGAAAGLLPLSLSTYFFFCAFE